MLHAVVSDIHGNLDALEAVLADLDRRRPASVACLGDFVGYGASPNECITRLRPRLEAAVIGNHDLAAIGRLRLRNFNAEAAAAARWIDAQLSTESRLWLESLPYVAPWHGALLVHASPSRPEEWNYVLSPSDAEAEMEECAETLVLVGHSHYPGIFELTDGRARYSRDSAMRMRPGSRYLVNAGSVGQPRDGDPRACYLLYDDRERLLSHVRVDYDIEGAMRRIREAGLPDVLASRLEWGE
jgi:diadenosine tetraphosphatase ApaH/serine/threonine PP2A family protein phosphatase